MNDNQCKIIIKNFDYELYNIYNNLDNPGKADIWRVFILYLHGGIYCDNDIECLKSFDELLTKYNSDIMFAREPDIHWNKTDQIMCNAFMISNKNNSFWLNYIKLIKEIYYKKKM